MFSASHCVAHLLLELSGELFQWLSGVTEECQWRDEISNLQIRIAFTTQTNRHFQRYQRRCLRISETIPLVDRLHPRAGTQPPISHLNVSFNNRNLTRTATPHRESRAVITPRLLSQLLHTLNCIPYADPFSKSVVSFRIIRG